MTGKLAVTLLWVIAILVAIIFFKLVIAPAPVKCDVPDCPGPTVDTVVVEPGDTVVIEPGDTVVIEPGDTVVIEAGDSVVIEPGASRVRLPNTTGTVILPRRR